MSWLPSYLNTRRQEILRRAGIDRRSSRVRDLGDGFEVRRALPSEKKRQMVGPFIFL